VNYLILKKGHSIGDVLDSLKDSRLKPVKDSDGNISFVEEKRDSGGQWMTVADVAALLQKPVSAVREMCKTRSQRGVHPLPFTKVGRTIRFDRVKVMRWLETMPQRPRRKR
jgi:excisionase family DNA binding protein